MPTPLDIAFALFYSVGMTALAALYFDKQLKRRVAAGVPKARLIAYWRSAAAQWLLALATLTIWKHEGRAWRTLGLVPPTDWRLYAGIGIAIGVTALVLRQNHAVRRLEGEKLTQLEKQIAELRMVLPHDAREYRWFNVLAVTAGVCEELLYRGFLTWLIAAYTGLAAAVIIVSVAFGLAHAYQGRKGMLKTGLVALVMGGIVVVSGWLIPAMIAHALVDIAGGAVAYELLIRRPRTAMMPAV